MEHMDQLDRQRRSVPFIRDVGVNVLANLAAALVLYLLGTALGFFPRNRGAIGTALVGLGAAIVYLLMFAGEVGNQHHRRELFAAYTTIVLGGIATTYGMTQSYGDKAAWWIFNLLGLISAILGVWGVVTARRNIAVDRVDQQRLNGLHWFEWHA
jgi:hypothetical protein